MKLSFLATTICLVLHFAAHSQERDLFYLFGTKLVNDSVNISLTYNDQVYREVNPGSAIPQLLLKKEARRLVLHTTRKGQEVELHYFPGTSNKKALIIGGMHGSELSSIEVARTLVCQLTNGAVPYYHVFIVPSLFPDNALEALHQKGNRIFLNTGRFTTEEAADPNRQMPLPGKPFLPHLPLDAMQRMVEEENQVLLQLIQSVVPDRLISIHAIKDRSKAGVFADPRTDCEGFALGFDTDKALALLMAQQIRNFGGACPGNNLEQNPTAVYYLDPPVAERGQKQQRSYQGSNMAGRGRGISLGTWCSTAVCHEEAWSRPAIRTFTMEFPGYQKPSEYKEPEDQRLFAGMVEVYAASINNYFLQPFYVED